MYEFLNILLFVVHTALMAFNMTGWIWKRTRHWHLLTVGATLFSWLVMGAWRGWGYCLCADWHFQIRRSMGIHDGVSSYLQLLVKASTGAVISRPVSDVVTVGGLVLILIAMAVVWGRRPS